jgi:rubrerythrin
MLQDAPVQEALIEKMAKIRLGRNVQRHVNLTCPTCGILMYMQPMMVSPEPFANCPSCRAQFLETGLLEEVLRASQRTRS